MLNEFKQHLLGTWSNKYQAMANPTSFAWIFISWEPVGRDKFKSKQWYHYEGEGKPYRERIVTFSESTDHIIIEYYDSDGIRNEKCDTIFKFENGKWIGKNVGEGCIVRGAVLQSDFILSTGKFMTRDAGYLNTKMVWGSKNFYDFGRLAQR